METFNIFFPTPILAPYIRHYWTLEIDGASQASERVIPTGCMSLVFHRGSRMMSLTDDGLQPQAFICGQSTGFTDIVSTGRVSMVVVVFEPYGAKPFFRMPMNELREQSVSVHDMEDKTLTELEDKLLHTTDDRAAIDQIEQFLIKRMYTTKEYNYKRLLPVIETINRKNEINITTLSEISCLSYKQFNRIFSEYVGTNPKEFFRIVRFQRALYVLQNNPRLNMTSVAFECGYYDQPHLIKEFKAISGYTPTEFIAICAPHSDYFSELQ